MSRYKSLITWILISIFAVILPGTMRAQKIMVQKAQTKQLEFPTISRTENGVKITVTDMLATYGEAYDCFFTIEQAAEIDEPSNKLEAMLIQRPSAQQTFHGDLQYDLEELRQIVPNFTYQINKNNPRIIHIIDDRLAKQADYGLDKIIPAIDFKGTVIDLIQQIGKQGIPIGIPKGVIGYEYPDTKTKVHVEGEGLQVRDALSNFVKLEGRYRILWVARTNLTEHSITSVRYLPILASSTE